MPHSWEVMDKCNLDPETVFNHDDELDSDRGETYE